jgi:hypothetical protein
MDGDGKKTTAFDYAGRIVDRYSSNLNSLVKQLNQYDISVAVQAMGLLMDRGVDFNGKAFTSAMKFANQNTRLAVGEFIKARLQVQH